MRLAYRCQMEDEGRRQGCLPIGGRVLHSKIIQVSNRMQVDRTQQLGLLMYNVCKGRREGRGGCEDVKDNEGDERHV